MLVRVFCAYFPPVIWCSKKNVKKNNDNKKNKKIKNIKKINDNKVDKQQIRTSFEIETAAVHACYSSTDSLSVHS